MKILVYGEDDFRSRQHVAQMRAKFSVDRDASGMNQVVFKQGGSGGSAAALEALFASPFLAEKKMVVLEGFLRHGSADDQTRLAEALPRLPESTVAIFIESCGGGDLVKSPLWPLLKDEKFSVEFAQLNALNAANRVVNAAQAAGVEIEAAAARDLAIAVGGDSWRLANETAKLAAMVSGVGRRMITVADVAAGVSGNQTESIFNFIDACTAGAGGNALSALDRLIADGMAEMQIISLMQKHFRTMIGASALAQSGVREDEVARILGVHPFVAKKSLMAVKRFSSSFLRDRYVDLVQMEKSFKTGTAKPRVLIEIFTARLAATCSRVSS